MSEKSIKGQHVSQANGNLYQYEFFYSVDGAKTAWRANVKNSEKAYMIGSNFAFISGSGLIDSETDVKNAVISFIDQIQED